MQDIWRQVDDQLGAWLLPADAALDAALAASAAAGLPPINVTPLQGRLLQLLARSIGARRILEIGTLGGYSTIWLARALDAGGRLVTLERDASYAGLARANLDRAGLADRVEVLVGDAADTLRALEQEEFDLTFIDADKASTPRYADWAIGHTRRGGLVVVDNVVRQGAVVDPDGDANVQGIREFLAAVGRDPRVTVTAVQTVGAKGYDGLAIVLVGDAI